MGEGGAVNCREPEDAARIRGLRSHGITRDPEAFSNTEMGFDDSGEMNAWYYEMPDIGFNYRVTDLQCALGLSQLAKLDRFLSQREFLRQQYEALLQDKSVPALPVPRVKNCEPGWHLFSVLIDFDRIGKSRHMVMQELQAAGVGSQVHYIPVHQQPYYRKRYGGAPDLPGAQAYYDRTLSLPLYPSLTVADIERVVEKLAEVLNT